MAGAEWRRGTEGQGEGGEGPGAARVGPCGLRGGRGGFIPREFWGAVSRGGRASETSLESLSPLQGEGLWSSPRHCHQSPRESCLAHSRCNKYLPREGTTNGSLGGGGPKAVKSHGPGRPARLRRARA